MSSASVTRWQPAGPALTLSNAAQVSAEGLARLAAGGLCVDFSSIERVDSAALAVILEWRRAAQEPARTLEIEHLPANLVELADLYGVAELVLAHHHHHS